MGTNYYLRQDPCAGCGRFDSIHIGKKSAGWSFVFRGYLDLEASPFIVTVMSRQDWTSVIESRTTPGAGWRVVDEYGVEIKDPVQWVKGWPAVTLHEQLKEDGMRHHGSSSHAGVWRDAEGFFFMDAEFS